MLPPKRPTLPLALCGWLLAALPAFAQDREAPTLEIRGMYPAGVRNSVTNKWGVVEFFLTNRTDQDRLARVLFYYKPRPDVLYGRDVWVPARSTLKTRMLAGPAPVPMHPADSSIEYLLYDRTDGSDRLIRPPGELRVRDRGIFSRPAEVYSVILLDEPDPEDARPGQLPQPPTRDAESSELVRVYRAARELPPAVFGVPSLNLPVTPEAFDGANQVVLASEHIARDPAAMRALRRWLERGGHLWVMLDRVDPDRLAPLLGEALDFQVVGRVGLTTTRIETHSLAPGSVGSEEVEPDPAPIIQEHEQPVQFVRVLLPAHEPVRHTVDGWPAWFTREVGRGQILFTTLGPRGWYRRRKPDDPSLPVGNKALGIMAGSGALYHEESPVPLDPFREPLSEEIGYSVVPLGTVAGVFAAFLLGALALGLALRRARRPELQGWLGPVAALGAAVVLFALGQSSRRAAGPTVAIAQVVHAVPGVEEASVHGLLAVYHPEQGLAPAEVTRGGLFELDPAGLEGQGRRLIQTDLNAWHWEGLALPAGVRFASFRATVPTGEPLRAVARFGPEGLEGELTAGPFRDPADLVLRTANGRNLVVRLGPEGTFRADRADALPEGQFLSGAVLSDRQQRRQALYREFFKTPTEGGPKGQNLLLAWAEPADLGFTLAEQPRVTGSALLMIPLELERPAPGQRVTIPGQLIPYQRRIGSVGVMRPVRESNQDAEMHLRFQLPREVLPFKVEGARLVARIDSPSRRVTVSGYDGDRLVELHRVESPLDPITVDLGEERFLRLDREGGLHLHVSVRHVPTPEEEEESVRFDQEWTVEYLELEVTGQSITPTPNP
jgi:hypothetical protein